MSEMSKHLTEEFNKQSSLLMFRLARKLRMEVTESSTTLTSEDGKQVSHVLGRRCFFGSAVVTEFKDTANGVFGEGTEREWFKNIVGETNQKMMKRIGLIPGDNK